MSAVVLRTVTVYSWSVMRFSFSSLGSTIKSCEYPTDPFNSIICSFLVPAASEVSKVNSTFSGKVSREVSLLLSSPLGNRILILTERPGGIVPVVKDSACVKSKFLTTTSSSVGKSGNGSCSNVPGLKKTCASGT